MLRLLRTEYIKVRRYRTFWAVLGIYGLMIVLISGALNPGNSANPGSSFFSFPDVWVRLANTASYLNVLPSILIMMLISNEYTFRTFRQNLIDGFSRAELVYSKFLLIASIGLLCIGFIFLWGLSRGILDGRFDKLGDLFQEVSVLFNLFIQLTGYMALAALTAFVFKKAAFSILIYLLYAVALERFLRWRTPDEIDRFFPMNVFSELLPDAGMLPMQGFLEAPPLSPSMVILLAAGYIALFFGASLLLLEKSDL